MKKKIQKMKTDEMRNEEIEKEDQLRLEGQRNASKKSQKKRKADELENIRNASTTEAPPNRVSISPDFIRRRQELLNRNRRGNKKPPEQFRNRNINLRYVTESVNFSRADNTATTPVFQGDFHYPNPHITFWEQRCLTFRKPEDPLHNFQQDWQLGCGNYTVNLNCGIFSASNRYNIDWCRKIHNRIVGTSDGIDNHRGSGLVWGERTDPLDRDGLHYNGRCALCSWKLVNHTENHLLGQRPVFYFRLNPCTDLFVQRTEETTNTGKYTYAHYGCYDSGLRDYNFMRWMACECIRGLYIWGVSENHGITQGEDEDGVRRWLLVELFDLAVAVKIITNNRSSQVPQPGNDNEFWNSVISIAPILICTKRNPEECSHQWDMMRIGGRIHRRYGWNGQIFATEHQLGI